MMALRPPALITFHRVPITWPRHLPGVPEPFRLPLIRHSQPGELTDTKDSNNLQKWYLVDV
jgi:hypothetical protein